MSVQEIEQAIKQLPAADLKQLVTWLADYHQQVWDKELEDDLNAGRLDALLSAAESEYQAGHARPL
jgi:hypothetical protein